MAKITEKQYQEFWDNFEWKHHSMLDILSNRYKTEKTYTEKADEYSDLDWNELPKFVKQLLKHYLSERVQYGLEC